ncbi:MAG: DUF3106 domain-containing protein [Limisphaerales bacterium]
MNRWTHARWFLVLCAAGQLAVVCPGWGDETNAPVPSAATPPYPPGYSPVDLFRQLLAMSPEDRNNYLAQKPPQIRQRILDKIQEYLALDPNERELRLRATELRWFLLPLMKDPPSRRDADLAQAPERVRDLVKQRLIQWEILPPELQQQFLDNENALHYLAQTGATNPPSGEVGLQNTPSDEELARWKGLTEPQRNAISAQFNEFFELTPDEKSETLNLLSDAERAEMEKTLQAFSTLSPDQRLECIRAFNEFAGMSARERTEFLKNAQRWSQLSPRERQAWRDLVTDVPKWPPLPPGALIMPAKISPPVPTPVATN